MRELKGREDRCDKKESRDTVGPIVTVGPTVCG